MDLTEFVSRVNAGEFGEDLSASIPGPSDVLEPCIIVVQGGMPGLYVSSLGDIRHTDTKEKWGHFPKLAARVANLLNLRIPAWASARKGRGYFEPHHFEYGSTPSFKALHYRDRLKQCIGWGGPPNFEWEEPALYTPQYFARWTLGTSEYAQLQSGGRDYRTGKELPTELRQLLSRPPSLHSYGYLRAGSPNVFNISPTGRMDNRSQESSRYNRRLQGFTPGLPGYAQHHIDYEYGIHEGPVEGVGLITADYSELERRILSVVNRSTDELAADALAAQFPEPSPEKTREQLFKERVAWIKGRADDESVLVMRQQLGELKKALLSQPSPEEAREIAMDHISWAAPKEERQAILAELSAWMKQHRVGNIGRKTPQQPNGKVKA